MHRDLRERIAQEPENLGIVGAAAKSRW